jgi:nucleotide-binding universal stress UspA family protein
MYHKILLALEGKPTDEAAIRHGIALAQARPAELTALRVIAIAADGGDGMGRHLQLEPGAGAWRRKLRAETMLAALGERLQDIGVKFGTAVVIGDRAEADEVVDFAAQGGYDLIVAAADGRPWWQRALFGCLADGVHHKAAAPVLLVGDGTRRAKAAAKPQPEVHPMLATFSHLDCC